MIRQNIILGEQPYIVDLYKHGTDKEAMLSKEWCMLRGLDVMNGVAYDSDIYFVEKDILSDVCENFNADNQIVFPVPNSKGNLFSTEYTDFNSNLSEWGFHIGGQDVYDLYKKQKVYDNSESITLSPIKCDTLRVYHPHTKVDLPYIIYVDSYVNNIHLHFFCRRTDKLPTFTENEFTVENILYSEFFEVSIPNFEDLFAKDTYFKENLNIVSLEEAYMTVTATGEDTDGVTITDTVDTPAGMQEVEVSCESKKATKIIKVPTDSEYSGLISQNGLDTFVSMHLLTLPFKIEPIDNAGHHKKVFLAETSKSIENNYISYPITVTLFPYSGINESLNTYQVSDKYDANSDVFTQELKFMLSSTMGFNHGVISVVSKFMYPNPENFNSFREAYEFYNNVSFDDYEKLQESDEEYADGEEIKMQCGFEIEIASDVEFTQIIYKNYFEANEADDFAFRLDNIFDSWANMPELLICRVRFIDRYVGISIYGNQVIITKEWFKYLVNDSARHRIHEVLPTQPQWGYGYRIKSQKELWTLL